MRRALSLYGTSVGKKIVMAASGLALVGFVIGHLAGNLKIFQGAEKYNAYADWLHHLGAPALGPEQALWIARAGLLAAVAVHIHAALTLWRKSRVARPQGYRKGNDLSFSYASRTMRWGGVIILGFVVYHLLHLTWGTAHHDYTDSVYHNVVSGFRLWPVALVYMLTMLPLGAHLYHGLWSATQTLAVRSPHVERFRRPVAAAIAIAVVLGNLSIPIAVLAGVIE